MKLVEIMIYAANNIVGLLAAGLIDIGLGASYRVASARMEGGISW